MLTETTTTRTHKSWLLHWSLACWLVAAIPHFVFSQGSATERSPAFEPAPTTWTNDKGVPIEAEFVRMTDEGVVLRLVRDGREATVPLTKLSIESIYQATRLANPEEFTKPIPQAEVKPDVPELPELNFSLDEMLQSPYSDSTTIEQFFEIAQRLPAEGNYMSLWHGLPPKMQTDVEDLIVRTYQLLGPSTITQLQTLINSCHSITSGKRSFILNHPLLSNPPQLLEQVHRTLPLASGMLQGLGQADLWEASNFQKGSVARWLAKLNRAIAPSILAAQEIAHETLGPGANQPQETLRYNIVSQSADTAEVEVIPNGAPAVKKRFQKIGNIWIDVQAMNQLRKGVNSAKEKLAADAKPEVAAIQGALGGTIAAIGGLERAQSQEEFDQAIAQLRTISEAFAKSMGIPLPGSPGAGSSSGSQMGSGGYSGSGSPMNSGGYSGSGSPMNSGGFRGSGTPMNSGGNSGSGSSMGPGARSGSGSGSAN